VARARVERRLPNRITVEVEERRAAAAVLLDALYLADRSGRVFKRADVPAGETDGLVVVTGLERRLWQGGSDAGRALVARALDVVDAWRAARERPPIGEVHVDADGLTLYTVEGGIALRVGDALGEGLEQRFSRFDAAWGAMTQGERKRARTFHLDSTRPDRVTVRLAGTQ
jgi:cell division septal protein FtsQ